MEAGDRTGPVREGKVVVEQEVVALAQEKTTQGVVEQVDEFGLAEHRVRRQPAAPAHRVPPLPVPAICCGETALLQGDLNSGGRVEPGDAVQFEPLARRHPEAPLAAVPVTAEHHHLALAHVQAAVRIQTGGHVQFPPVERAGLDLTNSRGDEHHDEEQPLPAPAHPVPPGRQRRPAIIRAEAVKRW